MTAWFDHTRFPINIRFLIESWLDDLFIFWYSFSLNGQLYQKRVWSDVSLPHSQADAQKNLKFILRKGLPDSMRAQVLRHCPLLPTTNLY